MVYIRDLENELRCAMDEVKPLVRSLTCPIHKRTARLIYDYDNRGINAYIKKSPRADGQQHFVIDQSLIDEFAEMQAHQWDDCRPKMTDRIWGLFGENDHLAHFEPLFLQHYTHAYHFPGAHTPTAEEMQEYYVPLVERLISNI